MLFSINSETHRNDEKEKELEKKNDHKFGGT